MSSSSIERATTDVFAVPHARMKELVNEYIQQVLAIRDFGVDKIFLENILQSVYKAMWELKTHEYIEDTYIMNKLKDKLQSKRVYNKLVCNCHEDSKLINVIDLVERVYSTSDIVARQEIGSQLQSALKEFMSEFLHHMTEEESIFQPLLNKYFDQNELAALRDLIIAQHKLWKEKVRSEKSLKMIKRKREPGEDESENLRIDRLRFRRTYCEEVNDFFGTTFTSSLNIDDLPNEIMLKIFKYFSPSDLARNCCLVSKRWHRVSFTPSLWTYCYPVQWSKGNWSFHVEDPVSGTWIEDDQPMQNFNNDEEEDDDNNNKRKARRKELRILKGMSVHLFPKIGSGIKKLVLTGSLAINSQIIRSYLQKTPNITVLDLSYCPNMKDDAFKGLFRYGSLRRITDLDLSGCSCITDTALDRFASCFFHLRLTSSSSALKRISLSGCHRITDEGLETLQLHSQTLEILDLSGCSFIRGTTLRTFTESCTKLRPEGLYYCNRLVDGPHPDTANGCQNLDCSYKECCTRSDSIY